EVIEMLAKSGMKIARIKLSDSSQESAKVLLHALRRLNVSRKYCIASMLVMNKDAKEIEFAMKEEVDFIALHSIRSADDVRAVRCIMQDKESSIQIVSTIDTKEAVEHFSEITTVSDAVIVARNDLARDLPYEELPALQDEMVAFCRSKGIPIAVSIHISENAQTGFIIPSSAEVMDIAHAAMTGVDATMPTIDSDASTYLVEAVQAMDKILRKTEEHLARFPENLSISVHNKIEANAESAVKLANSSRASALLVFTQDGLIARAVSKLRPHIPIVTFTNAPRTQHKLQFYFGIHPLLINFADTETTVKLGINSAKDAGIVQTGSKVIIISNIHGENDPLINAQIQKIE
ncbi:hypothetical protein KJ996_05750, partial [Patescibacteria group bacterium]|nr:hypothetical protein [Patescibacteria group bacterium]